MEDTYVYVSVKLYLKPGQTEDSIQDIIQDMDYSFDHNDITDHEIVDILDTQISEDSLESEVKYVDPFDLTDLFFGD
jgi:hypothetical protein